MSKTYSSASFNFLWIATLFFIMAVPIYIFTNSAQEFPFLYILSTTYYFLPFW